MRAGNFLIHRVLTKIADVRPSEVRSVLLAFVCNFVLMATYYLLRPVRDAMATVFGVGQLQNLFTGTLVLTLCCSPVFAWLTDTFKLARVLTGIFWFLIINLLCFYVWFQAEPDSRWLAAVYYWWFSVVNLFMVSVFWSLMVDLFTATQATRLLPAIAAGGSIGAVAGPLVASLVVKGVGVSGVLLLAVAGLGLVIATVHWLIGPAARHDAGRLPGLGLLLLPDESGDLHAVDDLGCHRGLFHPDGSDQHRIRRSRRTHSGAGQH